MVFYFTGTAIRHCSDEKGWLQANLFNCTTVTFTHLKKMVSVRQRAYIVFPTVRHSEGILVYSWLMLILDSKKSTYCVNRNLILEA